MISLILLLAIATWNEHLVISSYKITSYSIEYEMVSETSTALTTPLRAELASYI